MTGNVRKKVSREKQAVKANQEKKVNPVKQKTAKPRVKKKVAQSPPEQNEKAAKKKRCKTARPEKVVHNNPLDRIRQMEPQKGSSQQYVHHFTGGLKEINRQNNTQPDRSSVQTAASHVDSKVITQREPAQIFPKKTGSPAVERRKKLDSADKERILRRQQASTKTPKRVRNAVPLQLTYCNITVPSAFTFDDYQPSHRTVSRAQALVELAKSRLTSPHSSAHLQQGLSALAPDLPPRPTKSSHTTFSGKSCAVGLHVDVPAGDVPPHGFQEDVSCVAAPHVSGAAEPRSRKPKRQVFFFEDWRPGSGRRPPQKLLKPQSVDRGQWQRQEIERQQDLQFAQKIAMRKKELRYFRRLEGVGKDIEESGSMNTTTTSTPARDTQSIANFPIRGDVEEMSARGYDKFLYRPDAASEQSDSTRPTTCDTRKSIDIVGALSVANARRVAMRKELEQRLREERARKKLFLAEERAAERRRQLLQCRCPGKCC